MPHVRDDPWMAAGGDDPGDFGLDLGLEEPPETSSANGNGTEFRACEECVAPRACRSSGCYKADKPVAAPDDSLREGQGRGRKRPTWTPMTIKAALILFASNHGRTPSERDAGTKNGLPAFATVTSHFGSWANAVQAAGLSPPPKSRTGRPPGMKDAPATPWAEQNVIAAIQKWAQEHDGRPPSQLDWHGASTFPDRPNHNVVQRVFGNWGNGIEAAGFDRRMKFGLDDVAPKKGWVTVHGTGLRYRNPTEAYVAAEQIEEDGARVADGARHDGNEAKAEKAIDRALSLAERVRSAARAAEEGGDKEPTKNVESSLAVSVESVASKLGELERAHEEIRWLRALVDRLTGEASARAGRCGA